MCVRLKQSKITLKPCYFILNFLGDCDFKFIKINVSYFTVVEKYIGHNFYKIGAFHFHPFPQAILIPFN